MKLSKGNLLAVEATRIDKNIPALDNVHIEKNGSTAATNGLAVLAVSPIADDMRERVPLDEREMFSAETVNAETIKEVLKNMPRDTQFHGVLEHCDFANGKFELTDGKRRRTLGAKTYPRDYVDYKSVLRNARARKDGKRCAINIKRLLSVLSTLDKICPDSSKNSAVFMEFTSDNNVFFRIRNVATNQRVVAYMKSYDTAEVPWPELDEWESELFDEKPARKIRKEKVRDDEELSDSSQDAASRVREQIDEKSERFRKWKINMQARLRRGETA